MLPMGGVEAGQRFHNSVHLGRYPGRRREMIGHIVEDDPTVVAVQMGVVTARNGCAGWIAVEAVKARFDGVGLFGDEGDGVGTAGQS